MYQCSPTVECGSASIFLQPGENLSGGTPLLALVDRLRSGGGGTTNGPTGRGTTGGW